MKGAKSALAILMAVSFLKGCGGNLQHSIYIVEASLADEGGFRIADESQVITINGVTRSAEILRNGTLVIEGDIIIPSQPQTTSIAAGLSYGVHLVSLPRKWVNGVVPFEFEDSLSNIQQGSIQKAMNEWSVLVPGISFRERTENDQSFVTYKLNDERCSSFVGRIEGRSQDINLTPACLRTYSTHHEIGHALGLQHEQTRTDRDSFVDIHWSNIRGCLGSATNADGCGFNVCVTNLNDCGCDDRGSCGLFANFQIGQQNRNLFQYNYESIMQYGQRFFSKNGESTITVIRNNPETNRAYNIDNRSYLSEGDIRSMNALYPVLKHPSLIFKNTGILRVCNLMGRELDHNTDYTTTIVDKNGAVRSYQSATIDSKSIEVGRYSISCSASSVFWSSDYNYPTSLRTLNPSDHSERLRENYQTGSGTLVVLESGLIPVLF